MKIRFSLVSFINAFTAGPDSKDFRLFCAIVGSCNAQRVVDSLKAGNFTVKNRGENSVIP